MSKVAQRIINYIRRANDQETIIKYLRTLDFEFMEYEIASALPKVKIAAEYERFQFMIRNTHLKSKPWDIRVIVGIKIVGRRVRRIIVFKDGKFLSEDKIAWNKMKVNNFRKIVVTMKFTDNLTYIQRRQWRNEHDKVKKNPNYKPSEFYLKHIKDVTFIGPTE